MSASNKQKISGTFENSPCDTEKKLKNFSKYVHRLDLGRFVTQYELFKKILGVKGSIVECGVHHGGGLMAWAKLSDILEPYNFHRKIIGFDTFEGFPSLGEVDLAPGAQKEKIDMLKENYDVVSELQSCINDYNRMRIVPHQDKVILVKGDANETIPKFIDENPHLLISLLYLDFDLYEPTATALEYFLPRMPKGAIIGFDEVNNPGWPGETKALLETFDLNHHTLECFPHEANISWITL